MKKSQVEYLAALITCRKGLTDMAAGGASNQVSPALKLVKAAISATIKEMSVEDTKEGKQHAKYAFISTQA